MAKKTNLIAEFPIRKLGVRNFRRWAFNTVKTAITSNSKDIILAPFSSVFYATFACNLNCIYCDHPDVRAKYIKKLDTPKTLSLIEKMYSPGTFLTISGGEPLIRTDLPEILQKCRSVGFRPIFLNTNAYSIDNEIGKGSIKLVDYVSVSLDSMDSSKWDNTLRRPGASERIVSNIEHLIRERKKYGIEVLVNTVITPESIKEVYGVIEFCAKNSVQVNLGPVDVHGMPDSRLRNNEEFRKLMQDLIKMKKERSAPIASSLKYLEQVRDFSLHDCLPSLVTRVLPDGSVAIPCDPLAADRFRKYISGLNSPEDYNPREIFPYNLQDYPDLNSLLKEAYQKEGLPLCVRNTDKCFMPCHLTPTNAVKHPLDFLFSGVLSWA